MPFKQALLISQGHWLVTLRSKIPLWAGHWSKNLGAKDKPKMFAEGEEICWLLICLEISFSTQVMSQAYSEQGKHRISL